MKWKFEPRDFCNPPSDKRYVDLANAKLDEWRAEATVVYGFQEISGEIHWGIEHSPGDTHRALLIDIEPLPKEPCKCKHEPKRDNPGSLNFDKFFGVSECRHCGVTLKATWSEDV